MKTRHLYDQGVMPIHLGAALLCLLLLGAGWVFGLGPLLSENQEATTVLDQAELAEDQAKDIKTQIDRLTQQLADVQQQLDDQPVHLQPASQINPLLAELAMGSETLGLSITRTSAGRRQALAYYDYVPIELAGEGGYDELLAFFKRLHETRGDLGVIGFSATRMTIGLGLRFEIDLAWYVRSEQPETPAEQATASVPTP